MIRTRIAALVAYLIPVLGWLYVLVAERKSGLAMFHLKQAIGLVLFLLGMTVVWIAVGWLLSLLPFGFVVGMALYALVIAVYVFGFVAWLLGMNNAIHARFVPLPLLGEWASRLPRG